MGSPTTPPSPYPYQEQALEALARSRTKGAGRALAVMASGLGKTLVSAFDHKRFEVEVGGPMRLLYLSERNLILDQAERRYRWVSGEHRSAGQFNAGRRELDADLVFASFQSLHPVIHELAPQAFDVVVVDEAHHSAAPTHESVLNHLRPRWLLGLTATPFRGDGQDIRAFYGDEVAVSLPLERALVEGLLTPIEYRVWSDQVDESTLERTLQVSARGLRSEGFTARNDREVVATILDQARRRYDDLRIVVFCASLSQMHYFATLFPSCRTISGEDRQAQQASTLNAFNRGEFEVLLSRDVLNEGVDMPDANTLVFLRNTESPVVFMQQLGRGLRRSENKERVLVLDFVDNVQRIQFVYAFYSRLRAEQDRLRSRGGVLPPESALHLDDTAKNVVRALLAKKRDAEYVVDLHGLQGAVDFRVGSRTLRRMVADGRLVPDYIAPDDSDMLFERYTLQGWLRQIQSPRTFEGLLVDREYARATGRPLSSVRRAVERDELAAAWVHRRPNGTYELFFDPSDIHGKASDRRPGPG